ncbi:hypothetical protein QBC42DRAFT_167857 [Cladorrhinum samala]|uniref:Uncharacterized protein n=1 Tax=Cladorrhinum samala TaxID=585594 RepID=A0AAV9I1Z7_9PEZI|nr:hypothetical protein QBC42DRAFT_167857 [Cladorrhinum samala]
MDGAKKNAEYVAQHLLPDRPYHLSLHHDRRYPKPEGFWFTGPSAALQYQTYLSDADRGVLFTLPPWAISEESSQTMPIAKSSESKGEAKKKLSVKEHLNRKKSPQSPLDNDLLPSGNKVVDGSSRTTNGNGSAVHARPVPPPSTTREPPKKDVAKSTADKSDARRPDSRNEKPRPEVNGERNRNPLPKPLPELDSRKRTADADGNPQAQKRPRNEVTNSNPKMELQPRQSRAEPPSRGRDRTNEGRTDTKSDLLHPTANGLAPSTSDRDRENTASPRSTIMVNGGSRVRSDSAASTPRKVPELLSPLHASFFDHEPEEKQKPRKKLAEKAPPPPASKRPEGPSPQKKKRPLPPLMSPTLPPLVEAALDEMAKKNPGGSEPNSSQSSDSPSSARKTITVAAPPPLTISKPAIEDKPSFIYTIKLRKANAKRAKELLSLPSKSAKDALKLERALSVEGTPPPAIAAAAAAAKKRPRPAASSTDDLLSGPPEPPKRGKPSALSTAVSKPAPTTPLKPSATAMVRAASSQSQGTTTPTPGTIDRPPTRHSEPVDPAVRAQMELFKERNIEYMKLGGRLKKTRDSLIIDRLANPTAKQGEEYRCAAIHLEMVLAYMLAFHYMNQARVLSNRPCEISMWLSLVAHFDELSARVKGYKVLRGLVAQLNGVFLEQLVGAYATLDRDAAMGVFDKYAGAIKRRGGVWGVVRKMGIQNGNAAGGVDGGVVMGPWTGVEEAVELSLKVVKRWVEREGVRWVPELSRDRDFPPSTRERDRDRGEHHRDDNRRDRDRDRDRDRERDRESHRDRERDRGRGGPPPSGYHHSGGRGGGRDDVLARV